MSHPFRIELVGAFYTGELYDQRGRCVYTLPAAAEAAEEVYGEGWRCVYNGEEAITRDEWLQNQKERT